MLEDEKEQLEKTKQELVERLQSGNLSSELEDELRAAVKRIIVQLEKPE